MVFYIHVLIDEDYFLLIFYFDFYCVLWWEFFFPFGHQYSIIYLSVRPFLMMGPWPPVDHPVGSPMLKVKEKKWKLRKLFFLGPYIFEALNRV